jgi:O-antigen ligase
VRVIWYLLIVSLPFTFSINQERLKQGGEISSILVVLLLALYLGQCLYRRNFGLSGDRATKYFAFFCAVTFLSIVRSVDTPFSEFGGERAWIKPAKQLMQLGLSAPIYFWVPYFVRNRKDFRRTLRAYLAALVLVLALGLVELWAHFHHSPLLMDFVDRFHTAGGEDWSQMRVFLAATEPSMAANYLLSVLPFVIFGAFQLRTRLRTWVLSATSLVLFVFTFSLSGYLALLVAVSIGLLFLRRSGAKLALGGVAVLAILLTFPSTRESLAWVYDRFTNRAEDFSISQRLADAELGWNTFLANPVLGVGIGNQPFYIPLYYPNAAFAIPRNYESFKSAYQDASMVSQTNMVIRILAETGLAGAILFVLWHFELFRTGWWSFRNSTNEKDRTMSFAILLAALSLTFEYCAMSSFHAHYIFFIFGLLPAWRNVLQSEKRLVPQPQVVKKEATMRKQTVFEGLRLGLRRG